MSSFLSGVAVVLSVLSLLLGGFAAYQVVNLREDIEELVSNPAAPTDSAAAPTDTPTTASPNSAAATNSPAAAETSDATAIQPGQFVNPAFEARAEVELLSAKRIENPETGGQNAVNVQFRLRRLAEDGVSGLDVLSPGQTTARNPDTSETYDAVDGLNRATNPIVLPTLDPQSSVDAYVWMEVPENVDTIDLYIENVQAFQGVPIEN